MSNRALLNVGVLRVLSIALAGVLVSAIGMYFPPEEFGKYSLVLSVVQISCAAILNWPNQAFLLFGRESFRMTGSLGEALGTRLLLHCVMLLFMVVLMACFAPWVATYIGIDPDQFKWIFLLSIMLVPLPDMALVGAQACGRFLAYGVAPVVQRAMQVGAVIAVLIGVLPTWQLLIEFSMFGYAASALLSWWDIPRSALRVKISVLGILKALRYARLLPIGTLGAFLLQWMDLWFIRAYLDEASVGLYAWSYTLTLLVMSLLVPLTAVLAPKAIDMQLDNASEDAQRVLNAIFSVCIFTCALMPLLMVAAAIIGVVAVPEKYALSLPLILMLAVALPCQMGQAFVEPFIYAQERLVNTMVLIVLAMVFTKAAANFLLVESVGVVGSAVATVAAYSIGMFLQWKLLRWKWGSKVPNTSPIIIGAIMLLAYAAVWRGNSVWFITFGCGLSIFLIFIFRNTGYLKALPTAVSKAIGMRAYNWLVRA